MAWLAPRPGNRQARDRHRLAPQGVQAFLDMEVAAEKAGPTTGVEGDPPSGPTARLVIVPSIYSIVVPSINSVRRRNPGILSVPATGFAGAPKDVQLMTRRDDLELSHGATAKVRENAVKQDRVRVTNAFGHHPERSGFLRRTEFIGGTASKVEELVAIIEDPGDVRLPPLAREALGSLVEQIRSAQARIKQLEATLLAWHRSNQASRRLATIPGVGVITATALVATIGDGAQFRSGRQLSAWLGLVPRQHSSGGKDRLGRISKRGDGYIRRLLVHGARSGAALAPRQAGPRPGWTDQLLARRPTNVVLVAMANKTARVAWALLRYERSYRPTPA